MQIPYKSRFDIYGNQKKKYEEHIYKSDLLNEDNVLQKGINPYFDFHGCIRDSDDHPELLMFKALEQEKYRNYGMLATYIIKTDNTVDQIYGESIGATYKYMFDIPVIAEQPDMVMIGQDVLTGYGYNMHDQTVLYCSWDYVHHEIDKFNIPNRNGCPVPGDLISLRHGPGIGNMMKITYFEDKNLLFRNHWTTYKFFCEVFNLGQDSFDTGKEDIDFLNEFDTHYVRNGIDNDNDAIDKDLHEDNRVIKEPNVWDLDLQTSIHDKKKRTKKSK